MPALPPNMVTMNGANRVEMLRREASLTRSKSVGEGRSSPPVDLESLNQKRVKYLKPQVQADETALDYGYASRRHDKEEKFKCCSTFCLGIPGTSKVKEATSRNNRTKGRLGNYTVVEREENERELNSVLPVDLSEYLDAQV